MGMLISFGWAICAMDTEPVNLEIPMHLKILSLPLLTLALLTLSGCSTPTVVTLQNGTQYLTEDMPKTQGTDGFYEFRDISGKVVRVKAADVATVKAED